MNSDFPLSVSEKFHWGFDAVAKLRTMSKALSVLGFRPWNHEHFFTGVVEMAKKRDRCHIFFSLFAV